MGIPADEVQVCCFVEATRFTVYIMDIGQQTDVAAWQFGLQYFKLGLAHYQGRITGSDQGDFILSCSGSLSFQLWVVPQNGRPLLSDMVQVDSVEDNFAKAVITDQCDVGSRDMMSAEYGGAQLVAMKPQPLIKFGVAGNTNQLDAQCIQEAPALGIDNPIVWHEYRLPAQFTNELQDPAHPYRAGIAGRIRGVGVQHKHVSGAGGSGNRAAAIGDARMAGRCCRRTCQSLRAEGYPDLAQGAGWTDVSQIANYRGQPPRRLT